MHFLTVASTALRLNTMMQAGFAAVAHTLTRRRDWAADADKLLHRSDMGDYLQESVRPAITDRDLLLHQLSPNHEHLLG